MRAEIRPHRIAQLSEAAERRLAGDYADGMSVKDLSRRFGVGGDRVLDVCRRLGVALRSPGRREQRRSSCTAG